MKEGKAKEYAKLIRLQALGASFPIVLGAFTVAGSFLTIQQFILLFCMGIFAQIYGFVLNDVMDVDIDKASDDLKERPLVKGTISKKSALLVALIALIIGYVIAIVFFWSILGFLVLIILTVFGTLYNFVSKKIVGSDVFVAGGTALLLLFGAIAVSDNIQSLSEIGLLTWILVLTAFLHLFYMNIVDGGIKDADHDYKAGVKTLAVAWGVRSNDKINIPLSFKIFGISLRSISIVLIYIPFILKFDMFELWQLPLLIILTILMYYFMFRMMTISKYNRERLGDYIRIQEMLRYSLIPVMLMGLIGFYWAMTLIIVPFVWYALFTCLLYGKPLSRAKTL